MAEITDLSRSDIISFFQRVAFLAEVKEWDNRKHIERVRQYVFILASKAGLNYPEAEALSIASILHDIGKSMIPEELLNRKGKFSAEEWKIVEQHTVYGKQLLEGHSTFILQTAEAMALGHHERWDGSGYPQQLKAQEIPYSARICAMADVFDALTTPRTYKSVTGSEEASRLIQDDAGKSFDPELVKVFQAAYKEIETVRLRFLKTQSL
jgi:putative two-component system response regulator